jgi:hypothetical protein
MTPPWPERCAFAFACLDARRCLCPERCPYTGHLEREVMAYVKQCLGARPIEPSPNETVEEHYQRYHRQRAAAMAGIEVVSLDDPAALHNAIAEAVGEAPLRKRRGRKARP